MLCSIPTAKSGSNWLDRLRSSKGFPAENSHDLEHVLNPNPNLTTSTETKISEAETPSSNSNSTNANKVSVFDQEKIPKMQEKKENWLNIMSCVLAELFNMGDSCARIPSFDERKISRKQSNPKMCVVSASASVDSCLPDAPRTDGVPAMSPSSVDNSVVEVKERKQGIEMAKPEEENLQKVGVDSDLSAFSRTEVTVIDTSLPVWKTEKLIFRKGTVWKIRDKKSASVAGFRKKRKLGQSDGREKVRLEARNEFGRTSREERLISAIEERPRSEKRRAIKENPADPSKVPPKRTQFSSSPCKPATKESSVFHIQCIPTNKRAGGYYRKSSLKDKKRSY